MTTNLLRPQDLLDIFDEAESKKMDEERLKQKKLDEQKQELHEAFMSREIHPQVMERINRAVRIAAQNGFRQAEIITFPSTYCNDRGRRINNHLPDWPESLEGFAKRAYDFYLKELRPAGYKMHAEVVSYPGGIPGDIAMYLQW